MVYVCIIILSSNYLVGRENRLRWAPLPRRYQNQVMNNSQLHSFHVYILICICNDNAEILLWFIHFNISFAF